MDAERQESPKAAPDLDARKPSPALVELDRIRQEYRRVRKRMEESERKIREIGPIDYLVRF